MAFHPDYKDLNIKAREARPEILYQWTPAAKSTAIDGPPFMYDPDYPERILLDVNNHPVKDWPELPKVLSGQIEGLYMEYWRRINRHITLPDIVARCPMTTSKAFGAKNHELTLPAYGNRMRRERVKIGTRSCEEREGSTNIQIQLKDLMPARVRRDLELHNTVKNWRDFKNHEVDAILAVNKGKGSATARAGNKALGGKTKAERDRKYYAKMGHIMEALRNERDADDAEYGYGFLQPGNGVSSDDSPEDPHSQPFAAPPHRHGGPSAATHTGHPNIDHGDVRHNAEAGSSHFGPVNDSTFEGDTLLNSVVNEGSTLVEENDHLNPFDNINPTLRLEDYENRKQQTPIRNSGEQDTTGSASKDLEYINPDASSNGNFIAGPAAIHDEEYDGTPTLNLDEWFRNNDINFDEMLNTPAIFTQGAELDVSLQEPQGRTSTSTLNTGAQMDAQEILNNSQQMDPHGTTTAIEPESTAVQTAPFVQDSQAAHTSNTIFHSSSIATPTQPNSQIPSQPVAPPNPPSIQFSNPSAPYPQATHASSPPPQDESAPRPCDVDLHAMINPATFEEPDSVSHSSPNEGAPPSPTIEEKILSLPSAPLTTDTGAAQTTTGMAEDTAEITTSGISVQDFARAGITPPTATQDVFGDEDIETLFGLLPRNEDMTNEENDELFDSATFGG
ncbi:MAG: hypothetical protein Q9220_002252 [cf. Caloplaca sp. 1 TL-2023]